MANFQVDTYNTADAALKNFRAGVYDLAILDFKMPDINGFDLYEKMHLIDNKMRVLFISGDHAHYQEHIREHPELSSRHFLNKPTGLRVLIQRTKELMFEDRS